MLARLKPEEAATVLQRLLAAHPDLRAEAGKMASDLLGEVSFEDVACEIEEAAWELLEEVVEPFLEDMKRQAELQSLTNALEICKGVVLGLYRVRHEPDGGTVLGWAPDFAPQTAMWAVEMWSTGGGGIGKVRSARRDRAALPEAFVETYVPEWRALIAQTLSRARKSRP